MPMFGNGLWVAEQNTKIPASTHVLSYRATLTAANAGQTIALPSTVTNPAQAVFIGIQPTGQPQQGRRLFVTGLVVRDANGALGGTAGGSVQLLNVTQGNAVIASQASQTTAGANPAYVKTELTVGTVVCNPNDQLAIQYVAPSSGTATGTAFSVDVFGYFQQAV